MTWLVRPFSSKLAATVVYFLVGWAAFSALYELCGGVTPYYALFGVMISYVLSSCYTRELDITESIQHHKSSESEDETG